MVGTILAFFFLRRTMKVQSQDDHGCGVVLVHVLSPSHHAMYDVTSRPYYRSPVLSCHCCCSSQMGPVRIRHCSHYFATQSSHSGWHAKPGWLPSSFGYHDVMRTAPIDRNCVLIITIKCLDDSHIRSYRLGTSTNWQRHMTSLCLNT